MQFPSTREARGFATFRLSRRSLRSRLYSFATVSLIVILGLCVCSSRDARGQQTTEPQTQTPEAQGSQTAAPSSSSQAPESSFDISRRGFESRRLMSKQRREAQLVTDTYTHRWEIYVGGQYMRFRPGPSLHNSGMGGWTLGVTRNFTPRFGITADARGYYGSNSLGPVNGGGYNVYNASFSVFPFTIGPQYRFYGSSKWSISAAAQVGAIYGYFDANTNGIPAQLVGFYPAGIKGAAIVSANIDYNVSPTLAVRLAPNMMLNNFGGEINHNQGFLAGLVYRFGRQ